MTRVLQRILRRRGATSDEQGLEAQEPEQQAQDTAPLPEQGEPEEATDAAPAGFRSRGRMRRRLRYLRRARELGFRDLGGLVFDLRRFERDRPDLVDAKIHALHEVDTELRALERALGDRRELHELREPGIASCPRCGALHGSEARFCPSCGLALRGPQPVSEVSEGPPAQLLPVARPQLPGAPPAPETPPPSGRDVPERSKPLPARPGQSHDEPAPFDEETPREDAAADEEPEAEPQTQVLSADEAEAEGDGNGRRRRSDEG
jgi:hypothetical protein